MSEKKTIKELLGLRKKSQTWLAKQIGVKTQTLSRWANLSSAPPKDTLERIAPLLGVSSSQIKVKNRLESKPQDYRDGYIAGYSACSFKHKAPWRKGSEWKPEDGRVLWCSLDPARYIKEWVGTNTHANDDDLWMPIPPLPSEATSC